MRIEYFAIYNRDREKKWKLEHCENYRIYGIGPRARDTQIFWTCSDLRHKTIVKWCKCVQSLNSFPKIKYVCLTNITVPAVVTIAPHVEDKTKDGLTFPEACKRLEEAGADVVGLNCCRGPSTMLPLLKEIKKVCKVSIYYIYYISVPYWYFSSISILLLLHAYRFINFNFNIWILCYKVWKENLRNCMMLWLAYRYALFKVLRIN